MPASSSTVLPMATVWGYWHGLSTATVSCSGSLSLSCLVSLSLSLPVFLFVTVTSPGCMCCIKMYCWCVFQPFGCGYVSLVCVFALSLYLSHSLLVCQLLIAHRWCSSGSVLQMGCYKRAEGTLFGEIHFSVTPDLLGVSFKRYVDCGAIWLSVEW